MLHGGEERASRQTRRLCDKNCEDSCHSCKRRITFYDLGTSENVAMGISNGQVDGYLQP